MTIPFVCCKIEAVDAAQYYSLQHSEGSIALLDLWNGQVSFFRTFLHVVGILPLELINFKVNAFEPIKRRLGPTGIEMRLTKSALESRKRSADNSLFEQLESRSFFFSGLDGSSDSLSEIKVIELYFYEMKGSLVTDKVHLD